MKNLAGTALYKFLGIWDEKSLRNSIVEVSWHLRLKLYQEQLVNNYYKCTRKWIQVKSFMENLLFCIQSKTEHTISLMSQYNRINFQRPQSTSQNNVVASFLDPVRVVTTRWLIKSQPEV
jgi:hypothetical protein